jgi:DNA modification methylase
MIEQFLDKVFCADAWRLLRKMPTASVDAVITDAMYGTSKECCYEWGLDPARGDPVKHWAYHEPIYEECLRVLKPGGTLAWAQGARFCEHFQRWFGRHRVWTLTRFTQKGKNATGHIWIVQSREQKPIGFPNDDALLIFDRLGPNSKLHPCIKPVEELVFLVKHLTKPGDIVLDCFCGLGSTLIAARQLERKFIGCDRSRIYCQTAMKRLTEGSA